jgi:hypothetical protein
MRQGIRSLIAVTFFVAAVPAGASVVVALDLPELVRRAELIVHGEVLRQESAWEDGQIVTRSFVRVHGALKGSAGKEVVVRRAGGVVHGIGQILYGEAKLGTGEEVVLFLRGTRGEWRVVGMAQGKFGVVADPRTGERHAVQDLSGLALARPKAGRPLEAGHASPARLPLRDFFSRVTDLVARPGTR